MSEFDQFNYLLLLPLRQDLNSSVREIPSPACQAKSTRNVHDLSPEEDALDHAADDNARSGVQRMVSSPGERFKTGARYRTCQLLITTRPLALGREPVVQLVELAGVSEAEADGRLLQVHEPATQSSIHEWQRRPLGSCKCPRPRLRPSSAHV